MIRLKRVKNIMTSIHLKSVRFTMTRYTAEVGMIVKQKHNDIKRSTSRMMQRYTCRPITRMPLRCSWAKYALLHRALSKTKPIPIPIHIPILVAISCSPSHPTKVINFTEPLLNLRLMLLRLQQLLLPSVQNSPTSLLSDPKPKQMHVKQQEVMPEWTA